MRNIHFSSFINILLFSCILLLTVAGIFRPVSYAVSNHFGSSLANDFSSPIFLEHFGLASLSELDSSDTEAMKWVRDRIEHITKVEQLSWSYSFTEEDGAIQGAPVQEDAVYVQVLLGSDVLYSNISSISMPAEGLIGKLFEYYKIETVHSITDADGNEIGSIMVGINPMLPVALTFGLLIVVFLLFMFALLLTRIMSALFTVPIITPILQLEQKVKALAEEDLEKSLDAKIVLKRPLREMESLMDSTNRIMDNMQRYAEQMQRQKSTLEDQNDELEAQNEELVRSKQQLQLAQSLLLQKEKSVRNLLDNARQGFLTFGPSLTVDDEFSAECTRLYGGSIAGRSFPELLAGADDEQRIFVERLLVKLFQETDAGKRNVYMPLLPDETRIGERHVQVEYKMIPADGDAGSEAERCMVILTDITEKRQLQNRMEEERNTLQMVVKVVVNYNDYASVVQSFEEWCAEGLDPALTGERLKNALFDLFRNLHTFKGSFAQLGMIRMAERLHEAESLISRLSKEAELRPAPEIARIVGELRMGGWLREEQEVLRSILGDAFFEQERMLIVDRSKLLELERKMVSTLSKADCLLLLPELRKLRFKPFKEMLVAYPDYVAGMAERLDRMLKPFEIEGGDFLIDGEPYQPLVRSIVHVFRNAVDHGIEPPDERAAAGKDEWGEIRCRVELNENELSITISDDGRGIDVDKVKRKALEKGVMQPEELERLTEDEALKLVFLGEISSKDEVTELSGRGVGLSSVLYEAERLGGTMAVESSPGKGTVFAIRLPYDRPEDMPCISVGSLLEPLANKAQHFFLEATGMEFPERSVIRKEPTEKILLHNVTSFIGVQGAFEGMFVLTMDEYASETLMKRMAYGEVTPEEADALMEDTLAEAANIIIGNSLQTFQGLESYMNIDPPMTVFTEGASVKVAESEVWACDLAGEHGTVTIGIIKK
ncbi:ATP-binding protein [Paenibacillus thermotolerans]|uniref:ATP-binding protein n=1 Tax=Paenibacillus thermotolerans TaxID=3027807 RepID=UPI002368590B|nr:MULTISPECIES: ATP-binding protein [unclassified Paenibacillus]